MWKQLNVKIVCGLISLAFIVLPAFAEKSASLYQNQTKIVSEQIVLLKNRLLQSQNEIAKLQHQQDNQQLTWPIDHVNKQSLNQAALDIAVAKSNQDSINIELSESQQFIARLEGDIQEIENQFNAFNVFGVKARNATIDLNNLQQEMVFQKNLLILEKSRLDYLEKLQNLANKAVQFYKAKYSYIENLLKSQTIMQLKEQQAKSEISFQQKQSYWLQQQNELYNQLNLLERSKQANRATYVKLENNIFYANENVNFTYIQMLIARYQDQIRQLKVSITRSSSITLLDKVSAQAQLLTKQLTRVNELLKTRMTILEKRKNIVMHSSEINHQYQIELTNLYNQYKNAIESVVNLDRQLMMFRISLDSVVQQELSSRQGLPGLGAKAWLDLGGELLAVPTLTFQMMKSLAVNVVKSVRTITVKGLLLLIVFEILWIGLFFLLNNFLKRIISGVPDHEFGHINLKWLIIKLSSRNLINIAIIGNLAWFFYFCKIPPQNFNFLINLALVWLFFNIILITARLCLVETVHDRAGHDVRLYHHLKWTFIMGGIITALTVFIHQLPLIYEVKDLFNRLFLFVLLMASIFLLRSWEVLPGLILPHMDEKHTYVRRVVRLLGLLMPLILLANSAIGMLGFVNFVQTISWYESIFMLVFVGYLFVRGLLNDAMEYVSTILISHTANGWLWTEAFLKPIDKILRLSLFFIAGIILFHFYNWDRQSIVVIELNKLVNYPLVNMLNTSITFLSIIELAITISCLFWVARWTREFVYRFLLSRTKDLGVRNSIAILSQYTTILIGIFICLRVLGIDFRALTFVAGAFAIGVGLGLRDLVNNFACGFLLLIERPLRVGDTVTINDHEGEVTHIGGRAVTIRTWDHMEVIVPNVEIFSKTFINWTAKDYIVRTVITIKISRHDKPQEVQTIIYKVLAANKDILSEPVSEVFLKELTDGMIEFEVRYFINLRYVKSRLSVRSEVLIAIWEVFEKHGIQSPYPHHEVHLKNGMIPLLESSIV